MLLSEDWQVVDMLKSYLEEYPDLEYNAARSYGNDCLRVEVVGEFSDEKTSGESIYRFYANLHLLEEIRMKLQLSTGKRFLSPSVSYDEKGNPAFFIIRKFPKKRK